MTGVQTCALPIWVTEPLREPAGATNIALFRNKLSIALNPPRATAPAEPVPDVNQPAALVTETYSLADLVDHTPAVKTVAVSDTGEVTSADSATQPGVQAATPEQIEANLKTLQRQIDWSIDSETWEWSGGQGTIKIDPAAKTLEICQTPEIHEQIARLLKSVR